MKLTLKIPPGKAKGDRAEYAEAVKQQLVADARRKGADCRAGRCTIEEFRAYMRDQYLPRLFATAKALIDARKPSQAAIDEAKSAVFEPGDKARG